MDRLSSGQESFDAVLGGGLPVNSIALLAGAPGSGKTMLAQQYAFRNGTLERPALIVTTVNEPLDKVVRFGHALSFFDASAVGTRVIYESLGEALVSHGLEGAMDRLVVLLTTLQPGLLIIDSFRALNAFGDAADFRRFVSELGERLAATAVSTIWVAEYVDDVLRAPEAAVADTIVQFGMQRFGQRTLRFLEVLKVRGSGFLPGSHSYRLGHKGIEVFTRLADPVDQSPPASQQERISAGSPALDAMLRGGVWPGTATLVVGPTGVGKTVLGLGFLTRAAAAGRPGVFATLQESRAQLGRMLWGDGPSRFEGRIAFHHRSPVDIYVDEWAAELLELLETVGADLLVIDSLSDLRLAAEDDKRFEEFTYSLVQRLSKRGITTILTLESHAIFGLAPAPSTALSSLADNLLLLSYIVAGTTVERAIHVLKSRASDHDPAVRRFVITSSGFEVGDPVMRREGLLEDGG